MTHRCGHCGGCDLESMADSYFCFDCGGETDMYGRPLPDRPQFRAPSFQERREAGEVQ